MSRTEFCSREHAHDEGDPPRRRSHRHETPLPDAKLLVGREEAGQLLSQPTRFGLPDRQPATAYHEHWWKGSDSHGRSAKVCSWKSSGTHRVLNAYAFWSDAATCLAINLVKGCKRSGRFAIYTMNSSLHLFSLAVLSRIFVLWVFDAASS